MKISLKMTGCKNNRYELNKLHEWALANGFEIESDVEADVCLINTCTVTQAADRKTRQMIRATKKANPKIKIVVFGCGARAEKEAYKKMGEISAVLTDPNSVIQYLKYEIPACRQAGEARNPK